MGVTPVPRSYEEFHPSMDRVREPGSETLVIHLPGFQREHLRLQLDNFANVMINGERHLDGNKWSRFHMEIPIPENCKSSEMRGRFENETLYVLMPKTIAQLIDTNHEQATPPIKESQTTQKTGATPISIKDSSSGTDKKTPSAAAAAEKQMNAKDETKKTEEKKDQYVDRGKPVVGLTETAPVAGGHGGGGLVNVVVAFLVVVALGIYAIPIIRNLLVNAVVAFLVLVALGIYVINTSLDPQRKEKTKLSIMFSSARFVFSLNVSDKI